MRRNNELGLSGETRRIFAWLCEQYVTNDYPNHRAWGFSPRPEDKRAFAELRAHGIIEMGLGAGRWRLTDEGVEAILKAVQNEPSSREPDSAP